ncbi:MAG: SUMF1/EgtB/PvdO family nonheme iron enzyme [Elainella sp.]
MGSGYNLLRGGSWNNSALNCRSANRNRNDADNRNNNLGFRVVRVVGVSS